MKAIAFVLTQTAQHIMSSIKRISANKRINLPAGRQESQNDLLGNH